MSSPTHALAGTTVKPPATNVLNVDTSIPAPSSTTKYIVNVQDEEVSTLQEFDSEAQKLLKGLVTFPEEKALQEAVLTVSRLSQAKLNLLRHNLRIAREAVLLISASVRELEGQNPPSTPS